MPDELEPARVLCGDMRQVLATLPAESVHAIVSDPPYGLEFMGRDWDQQVPGVEYWRACLRVAKPGAHLLAFGGTRTAHRLACAIEDAGWELRDCLCWLYGCLSDDTEILVDGQWVHWSQATAGKRALCYDIESGGYSWQPIEARFVYPYSETAYRIVSARTDQIVSRNHRCIVDRGDGWEFCVAEEAARQPTVRVPVLEDLHGLLGDVPCAHARASSPQQDVLESLRGSRRVAMQDGYAQAARTTQGLDGAVLGLRLSRVEAGSVAQTNDDADVLAELQRRATRGSVCQAWSQGPRGMDRRESRELHAQDERSGQPRMEGRRYLLPQAWRVQADQVRALPGEVLADGTQGWLRDGTSAHRRAGHGPMPLALGGGAPREPRPAGQSATQPRTVREQPSAQAVRGSRYTVADVARIDPVAYRGVVWCVKVPTGAFVARRNGRVFVTGNSGFPKSHDISKAIDREHGAVRQIVGRNPHARPIDGNGSGYAGPTGHDPFITAPATPAARAWQGFGTSLKPAHEPIYLARKPFAGTVAGCVQEHRCGALNVDGCRIGVDSPDKPLRWERPRGMGYMGGADNGRCEQVESSGRWPANLVLDEEAARLLDAEVGERVHSAGAARSGAVESRAKQHAASSYDVQRFTGDMHRFGDRGGPSRFFYVAKSSRSEREAGLERFEQRNVNDGRDTSIDNPYQRGDTQRRNVHPTVKPISLMRWLVRLITPPGGTVLDPFTGSGSTGVAAVLEGARFIGVELSPEYAQLATARIAHAADEDDGPQLTLFERTELKPVAKAQPAQASFLWATEGIDHG